MKTSVTIAGANAKASAFVVWRGFEESIRKASEYGYDGVELALKGADEIDAVELRRWMKEYSMEISCITTGQVFADLGLYFTHPDSEMRKKTVEVFSGLIDLAGEFGGIVNAGRTRGFVGPGQTRSEVEKLFINTMQSLCDRAAAKNVQLIIEPVNRYEINFINNMDQCAALLKQVASSNTGIMPDVFHMNIEDARIGEALIENAPLVKYIHLADSNRWAPGWGHLDFQEVFAALKTGGYDGWVSIEILPEPDPDAAAKQAAEYILPMVRQFNGA